MADSESTIRTIFAIDGHTQYKDAIKGINSEQTLLRSEMSKINAEYQLNGDKIQYNQGKVENLNKQIDLQKQKVKEAKNAVEQSTQKFGENSTETNKYTGELNRAEAQLMRLEKQLKTATREMKLSQDATYQAGLKMQETGKRWQEEGKSMLAVGKSLTLGVTTPIAAIGTVSAKAASDFETGMAGVRKTTDMTADELDEMSQSLRDMAKEIPISATELTKLTETAGQLGIKKENLVGFTRVMADLGVATNIAGQEGATAMAQFANVTGMAQTSFDRMGSSIVYLGNNTATTEKDILNMATRLASAGNQAKMTEADILGIAAGLASLGLEAQAGGSAFSKVINQIQLEVDTGGDKLESFAAVAGMTASEFSTAWGKSAADALSKFIVGLGDTEAQGKTTNEMLNELGITELRMGDALRRTSGASELFNETLEMSNRAWEENNALTNEASLFYETSASKLQLAKNAFNDAAIDLGQNLLPVITDVAGGAAELVSKFTDLPESTQNVIIKMGGLAAVLGPLMSIGGKVKSGLGSISTGIGDILTKAREASADGGGIKQFIGSLSGAGKAGLFGAAALAVAGLVALVKKLTEIPAEIKKVNDVFAEAQESIGEMVTKYTVHTQQIDALRAELDALLEIEEKSAAEKERMARVVEELNVLMPDLNLEYDKEADKLNMVTEEIYGAIDASKQRLRQELINAIIRTQIEAQADAMAVVIEKTKELADKEKLLQSVQTERNRLELAGLTDVEAQHGHLSDAALKRMGYTEDEIALIREVQDNIKGSMDAYNEQFGTVQRGYTSAGATAIAFKQDIEGTKEELVNLEKANADAAAGLEDYANAAEAAIPKVHGIAWETREAARTVEESHQKMNGVYQESADKVSETEGQKSDARQAGLDKQQEIDGESQTLLEDEKKRLDEYQRDLETATNKNLGLFGQFSEERLDISKTSAKEFNKHLEREITAFTNWHTNLQTIAELTNPETAKYLAGFGPQAAGLIEDYVKEGMGGELAKLPGLVAEQGRLAGKAAEDSLSGLYDAGKESGADWVKGIIAGMKANRKKLANQASSTAGVIPTETRIRLNERSPSKVGEKIGENWDEGLISGLENLKDKVGKTAGGVAGAVIDATKLPALDPLNTSLPSLNRISTSAGAISLPVTSQSHTESHVSNQYPIYVTVPTGETEDFGRRVGMAIAGQLQNRTVSLGL